CDWSSDVCSSDLGAPVKKIQPGIVGSGHPSHATAMKDGIALFRPSFRSWLTRVRLRVPAPLERSGFRIERIEEAANVSDVARDTGDNVIANHERSHRREVSELRIGELYIPTHCSILGVQTDHVRVGSGEVKPILVH